MCDEEYRAKATGNGTAAPPLLSQWTCELEGCGGAFVSSVIESVRATPRLDSLRAMVPCDLWTAIGNRTLWFFGDSQGQRFYRQARCFLRPFHDPPGQPLGQLFTEDPNYQQLIHRELLAGYDCCGVAQPMCTNLVGGGRICHFRVNKGWHMLQLLQRLHVLNVQKHDVIDFNVGLWHHMKDNNYTQLVQALADHVAANRASLPHLLWRDNSPQHFDIEHGEFPHPSEAGKLMSPFKGCKPFKNVTLQPDGSLSGGDGHVAAGGWRNKISTPIMQAAGVPIHYTWNNTAMMHDGHTAGECSHWCSPGAYSVSVWSLWRTILKHAEG
ncbi:hypothetical protein C2E20_2257 [Micractinium conductrix]|uniref:Uncharacterized protein n=1 Tax=Micractinium conductrix TaxID=554055 RepID=A0A2P6VKM7_9CHLO|nr:hypothetical protein C2E20_2257 [Micractinium conductrix]|eukprot:PSC74635.1 hypothetical protein C2E20_2257 [Micractinium conductrix]